MNIQKIQTSQNVKGFTLVELIVVITILAILGTIAFLSLQGQSAAARDSKRKTDLGNISTKIAIAQANGTSLTALATTLTGSKMGTISIGGAAPGTSYEAGTLNYTVLGIVPADFKDPKGQDYRLGVTTLAGGAFQLAATLEADNAGNTIPNALVTGTYNPRITAPTSSAPIVALAPSTTTLTVPLDTADIGKFKVSDTLTAIASICTAPAKVMSVSSDLGTLMLSCTAATAGTISSGALLLPAGETVGLVGSGAASGNSTAATTNGNTTSLPY